jgi:hypothetical protein
MVKLSNEFKERVQEALITVFINSIGNIFKSFGETLIDSKKFEARKEPIKIDNDKI